MIFSTLKAIHLLALMLGAGASLGNIFLMLAKGPHDLPAPGFTASLRKWYRLSALVAIVTLWITGLLMAASGDGWVEGSAFSIKLMFAAALLAIVGFLNLMAAGWARSGGPPAYVPALHVAGALCLAASVVFAAYAFA